MHAENLHIVTAVVHCLAVLLLCGRFDLLVFHSVNSIFLAIVFLTVNSTTTSDGMMHVYILL